jgi:hypothetical protein
MAVDARLTHCCCQIVYGLPALCSYSSVSLVGVRGGARDSLGSLSGHLAFAADPKSFPMLLHLQATPVLLWALGQGTHVATAGAGASPAW